MLVLTLERLPIVLPKADSQGSVGSDGRLLRELALKGGSGQEEPFEETGSSLLPSLSLLLPLRRPVGETQATSPPSFASQASGGSCLTYNMQVKYPPCTDLMKNSHSNRGESALQRMRCWLKVAALP